MMKRIISIAIVLVLALTALTGCALKRKLTAFELFSRAGKQIKDAGGVEIDCDVTVSMMGINITLNMNIQKNGDNHKVITSAGGETVMAYTVIGDEVYMDTAGEKIKYTMAKDNPLRSSIDSSVLPSLTEEVFEGIDLIENEDGTKTVTLNIGEELQSVLNEILGDTGGLLGGEDEEDSFSMSFKNAVMTMNFDADDDMIDWNVEGEITYDYSFLALDGQFSATYTFVNLGTAPEILPPEDAEAYEFGGEYGTEAA